MICHICKKEFRSKKNELICGGCKEICYLYTSISNAEGEWKETLRIETELWKGSRFFVEELISNVEKGIGVIEQAKQILEDIKSQIIEHLKFYNKDDVIVALMLIKEFVRRMTIKGNIDWKLINEYYLAIKLTEFVINIPPTEFCGASIGELESGYSNFISAISLGRVYLILDENIKNSRFLNEKFLDIYKMTFEFIETGDLEKYYDEYLMMGLDEKPEDYEIQNELLRYKLSQENKTPEKRKKFIDIFIEREFGFTLNNLDLLSKLIVWDEFKNKDEFKRYINSELIFNPSAPQLTIVNKKVLRENINTCIDESEFDAIINTFSINKFASSKDNRNKKALELMSVYETEELIIVGRLDFFQNVSSFEKFANSGHYIEMFKEGINTNKCLSSQQKLSSYLAYVIADKLINNGYKLPMEKLSLEIGKGFVPRAEINKIQVDGENILKQVGDLDVLAIDEKEKIIYIIELKNYKPAIDSKSLFFNDKNKIEDDEVFRKMKARESVIKNNISSVVNFIIGESEDDYKVKSIFVTARPNYYACAKEENIEYITWSSLIKRIEGKEL
ncbi:hypothetical protein ABHA39_10870 [Clostridium paraputrificum]|uniref:hypothetical protein n=1 Tax=Clostridium paraputrificum TaxID=29363 RepID=UPI00233000F0|nr:hypothetical protein [Clostridium paraputrificum]MDB2072171.1 hypothetical protein [Clostridium paraputrificum]MDB2082604.1 hypothetical protein [Clostridium paraputrificum]